ncbi:alpha/beta hydrolase family protein [Paucibacter sp. Y2R2-4]|uniref:alpha/beta hydrolase family protein n=1 Tax=Paucibacter sp. Y2R2-4 TaxID=2893553 RepID=UPI0021E3FD63|nr:hypothetical protein [Paucibacter sp. Y2R2-4]MCV2350445.1 hypothetical protein [Paucibacter sp. Y2R2-4]
MHPQTLLTCAALLLFAASGALAQATVVQRTDGTQISALMDLPAGAAKVPALVLAPGQGYHMSLPAMEATARALSERGVAVFRFNCGGWRVRP